jgi:hypothetical protein
MGKWPVPAPRKILSDAWTFPQGPPFCLQHAGEKIFVDGTALFCYYNIRILRETIWCSDRQGRCTVGLPKSGLFENNWEHGQKDSNLRGAEKRKIAADPSLRSMLDHFLRLADRCVEQGKISPKEHANLVDLCGNLKKALFKIGDQRITEREVPVKFTTRMLRP